MSAAPDPAAPRYAFGPFVVETANRRLLRDGEPVAITARVFDILVALVRHAGEAVEKDALIQDVWGGAAVEEGNVARQVSTLRKVLGDSSYIATLPGRGYQFVAAVEVVAAAETAAAAPPPGPPARRAARLSVVAIAVAALLSAAAYVLMPARRPASPAPP